MYRKSKSMFGKLLLLLLTLCCAIVLLFGLAACSETKGIASAVVNDNGELVITYTDGTSDNLGVVVGEKGDKGEQGEQGPQGDKGEQGPQGDKGEQGHLRATRANRDLRATRANKAKTDVAYPRSSSAPTAPSLSLHIRTTPRRR